jgi:hypothetical protein
MKVSVLITLGLGLVASARPSGSRIYRRQQALQNGQDAIAQNEKFKTTKDGDACQIGDNACVGDKFAQCVGGKLVSQPCGPGTQCAALPLVNAPGTSVTCTTAADLEARIAATGAQAGAAPPPADTGSTGGSGTDSTAGSGTDTSSGSPADGTNNAGGGGAAGTGGDPQTSLTLDPKVISQGFANDGQDVPTAGQVASLTSTNNFINFCLTTNLPLTNGQQNKGGSCNTAPIGAIPSIQNMPASKFVSPKNGDVLTGGKKPFQIVLAIARMQTGNFVNAQANYFAAPQQLNGQGQIIGHTHVVVELLSSLDSTAVPDPNVFVFFKGVNGAAVNGQVTADVTDGLDPGAYRLCSINAAANHQPVIVPVAQHGNIDDCVYFTVTA